MISPKRALRNAALSAAGGFALGWAAKTLLASPPPAQQLPTLVAVAPQDLPQKLAPGTTVTADGRVVTPLNALDPASLVMGPGDPCADSSRSRRK